MVQGCLSYYGVQGYADREVGSECGPSMDGPGMSQLYGLQGYSDMEVGSECRGHPWMVQGFSAI